MSPQKISMIVKNSGRRKTHATKSGVSGIRKPAVEKPRARTEAASKKPAPKKSAAKKPPARKREPTTQKPFFVARNNHISECGKPPGIDNTTGYTGYFENEYGEQSVFKYDRASKTGTFRQGDVGWKAVYRIVNGEWEGDGLILSPTENMWLESCWLAATGQRANLSRRQLEMFDRMGFRRLDGSSILSEAAGGSESGVLVLKGGGGALPEPRADEPRPNNQTGAEQLPTRSGSCPVQ